jgi:TatD DNase family protein
MTPASLFDSHCHLDDTRFDDDRDAVVERAFAAGVSRIVVPAVHPRDWDALGALRARYECVRVAVGVHPHALAKLSEAELVKSIDDLAGAARRLGAVAIGEVGFDGLVEKEQGVPYNVQTRVFDAHVEVAKALDLPLILHIYRAHEVALKALAKHGTLRGVVHSYSGSAELVPKYVALGLHLSFAGAITRPGAERPCKAARAVPEHRLLVETDAPDQAPHRADSARCEPAHLELIVRALAEARGVSFDEIAALTTRNGWGLFESAR